MAQSDNAWSRWVSWLKILLPLLALAMLSSIFLVSRNIDPTATLPYTDIDIEARAREPRLTAPQFSGVLEDGGLITVNASDIRPDLANPGSGNARDLRARLAAPDGAVTDIAGNEGLIDTEAGKYEMAGDVTITTSAGYRVAAPHMAGSLTTPDVNASGGVVTDGPMGRITSETMQLRPDAAPGKYLLVFKGGVRLVYHPVN